MKGSPKIPLTAGQAVTIHGWLRFKETLSWTDVLANPALTMNFLNTHTKIPLELLHRMQPDITAWVRASRVRMEDAPSFLTVWAAHPINDLKADLADIAALKWSSRTMRDAGVSYGDLKEAGMTYETMAWFKYSLYEWSTLGFTRADAEGFPAHALWALFAMTRPDVLRCLQERSQHKPPQ